MVFYKGVRIAIVVHFPTEQCEQNGSKHFDLTRYFLAQSTSYPQATRIKGKDRKLACYPVA